MDEWKAEWKKAKERTAVGSDFMQFGHFILAGCTNDVIANFEATMANTPIMSGYSPKCWQKAFNCMLLKQEGNYNVDTNSVPLSSWIQKPTRLSSSSDAPSWPMLKNTGSLHRSNMEAGKRKQRSSMFSTSNLAMTFSVKRKQPERFARMMPSHATIAFSCTPSLPACA
jgi:hypothetical protein